jgi:hypothetical protein
LDPTSEEHQIFSDIGRYAAARGFDAMRVPGSLEDEVVVFNRSALIVREPTTRAAAHEIAGLPTTPATRPAASPATGRAALSAPPLKLPRSRDGSIPAGFDQESVAAIDAYRGGLGGGLGRHAQTPEARSRAEAIDRAMAASPLPRDIVVWRGQRSGRSIFGPRDKWPADLTGREWTDESFPSTSTSRTSARKFTTGSGGGLLLRMTVPQGTGAIQISEAAFESEILLERGLRFRVTRDHGFGPDELPGSPWAGLRVLDVEVVPSAPSVPTKATRPAKRATLTVLDAAKREADATDAEDRQLGLYVSPRHPRLNTPAAAIAEMDRSNSPEGADDALEGLSLADLRRVASDKGFTVSGTDPERVRAQIVAQMVATRPSWPAARTHDLDRAVAELAKTDWHRSDRGLIDMTPSLAGLSIREVKEVAARIGLPVDDQKTAAEWRGAIQGAFTNGTAKVGASRPVKKATKAAPKIATADVSTALVDAGDDTSAIASILAPLNSSQLKDLARTYQIRGASKMRRDELVTALTERVRRGNLTSGVGETIAESAAKAQHEQALASLRALEANARRDALDSRSLDELKDLLRFLGLPVSGSRKQLVDRLLGGVDSGVARGGSLYDEPEDDLDDESDEDDGDLTDDDDEEDDELGRAEDAELDDEILRMAVDGDEFQAYWTRGKGLKRWATKLHPWQTLHRLLLKHPGIRDAEGLASHYFHVVFGIWPGERKGQNPAGPG